MGTKGRHLLGAPALGSPRGSEQPAGVSCNLPRRPIIERALEWPVPELSSGR
jgi:hypothetical protein